MQRRQMLQLTASLGLASGLLRSAPSQAAPAPAPEERVNPLNPPADGRIPVAFLLAEDAVVIDFTGPWEVFDNVQLPTSRSHPFELFTVAESKTPVRVSGGMNIVPNYTFANAPAAKIVVIPAQSGPTPAAIDWIKHAAASADLVMSVCTGAFVLAKTGLLHGKSATTHHGAYAQFAMAFPDVSLERGARYVETGNLATAGGLTSGIDLTLHVVERYYGRRVAQNTAATLEYQGLGWMDPRSNAEFAQRAASTTEHPLCPVCSMDADPSLKSVYHGRTYAFCMPAHKALFDAKPAQFAEGG